MKRPISILLMLFCSMLFAGTAAFASDDTAGEALARAVKAQKEMKYDEALECYREVNSNPAEDDPFVKLCSGWDLSKVAGDLIPTSYLYHDCGIGKLYQNAYAVIYIPNEVTPDTAWGIFYPGNTGGWTLDTGYVDLYVSNWTPDAIYVFMGSPWLYGLADGLTQEQAAYVLKEVSKTVGFAPNSITVSAWSNGGYAALHVAAYLYDQFGIGLERICILDMGQNWKKAEFLISEEEAQPILKSGTTVYQFGREGEAFVMAGAQQFASYGIPLVEVSGVNGNHTEIFTNAFLNGMMSWAVGKDVDQARMEEIGYVFTPVNF